MPVQEPEKKKTDIPVTDTEELKKQQSAVYENSFQKSGKLLPFLNAKAEYHMSRLDTVLGKIATQQDKIRKHENKIEQLGAKSLFSIFTPSSKRSIIKREGGEKRCGKRIRAM